MADEIKNKPVVNEQPKTEPVKNNTPKAKPFNDKAGKPVSSKPIMKQMGLSENDLEPIDQSPAYKAQMAAIEAGEKGGYRDYSDFNEKGELVSRPAKTVSLLGDSNKFHPDAQIRGIKDFGDHFEYQLKNPEDADFRDFRYDDKNGHLSKDLWDFKQKDEARIKAIKNKFDISKYPDVEKTPYGFIYNVNGQSITDLKEQDRSFGKNVDDNKNYGFSVTKDGDEVYYETFEDAYNAVKGGNDNFDDDKEYDNIDDDYERSYGPVDSEEKYQAYLKWKENGDSFDNIDGKIRNQMGLDDSSDIENKKTSNDNLQQQYDKKLERYKELYYKRYPIITRKDGSKVMDATKPSQLSNDETTELYDLERELYDLNDKIRLEKFPSLSPEEQSKEMENIAKEVDKEIGSDDYYNIYEDHRQKTVDKIINKLNGKTGLDFKLVDYENEYGGSDSEGSWYYPTYELESDNYKVIVSFSGGYYQYVTIDVEPK